METRALGSACALLAALVWAFATVLFKRSGEKVHPLALNLFKNAIAVVLLAATLPLAGESFADLSRHSASEIGILALSGFLGITLADTLFFYSLNLVGVGIVSIVNCLYSPFIILFAFAMLGESLTAPQWLGALLVLVAVLVTSRHAPPPDRSRRQVAAGILIGVLDMALMGFGIVLAKPVLRDFPVIWATLIRMLAGSAALALLVLASPKRRALFAAFRPSRDWRFSVPGSVLGAYLSCVLWIAGFKYADASVAAILNQTSTIFSIVLAALILKEALTGRKTVAVVVALAGIALVTFCGRGPEG